MQTKNVTFLKILEFLVCAFSFLIILKASLAIISLIILLIAVSIGYHKAILYKVIKSPILLVFVLYYLWHVLGMLWSTNTEYGLKDLETKLSFIVFPIIFSCVAVTPSLKQKGLIAFVSGCLLICIYLIYLSYIDFNATHDPQAFLYAGLSRFIHPTYLSMYLNIALIILFSFLKPPIEKRIQYFSIPAIIFLIVIIMMLSARMAIITNIASFFIFITLIKRDIGLKKWILYSSLFTIISITTFFITNHYYNRIEQVENAVQHLEENKSETYSEYNSATSRPELWRESLRVIKQHPLIGAGTGDIKDELFQEYENNDFQYALSRKLNPHNQFLHTTVGLGMIGLILLLLCFGTQLYFSLVNKDWLYFCFIMIISMNALTESNIEVQSGILLFNFLSMFFYSSLNNKLSKT